MRCAISTKRGMHSSASSASRGAEAADAAIRRASASAGLRDRYISFGQDSALDTLGRSIGSSAGTPQRLSRLRSFLRLRFIV